MALHVVAYLELPQHLQDIDTLWDIARAGYGKLHDDIKRWLPLSEKIPRAIMPGGILYFEEIEPPEPTKGKAMFAIGEDNSIHLLKVNPDPR